MQLKGNWNYPTSIRFGAGRIRELPEVCAGSGMRRPLLVTDPGLARLPMVAEAVRACGAAGLGCAVYSSIQANPVADNVMYGVATYQAGGHDGVIAFGGGSALDVGKAIALMVGQTRPLFDFEDRDDWYLRVNVAGMAPVVAVPTAAGTGSEVGRASVITDPADHVKKIIFHPRMMPAAVISDPELTFGLPADITAATGMDALSHSLEAYCSPLCHPLAEGIAVEGIRLVKEWLPIAVREGRNVEARSYMLIASSMGATAFQKGLGAMHSLSHPCGANLNTHHGLTNAVVMPYVLMWNREAIAPKLQRLAAWLGLPRPGFAGVLEWVLELRRSIGIPNTLADIGVKVEHAAQFAPQALADPSTGTNPLPMTERGFGQLYLNCIRGELAAAPAGAG
ncbi:MAG TPA: iron-containing alcohol dehydrogenase [Steroidobacteraceae bacterium]|nr:iron-containing alcohol dehydrogenase [Steroidobacteraceae bacterium]